MKIDKALAVSNMNKWDYKCYPKTTAENWVNVYDLIADYRTVTADYKIIYLEEKEDTKSKAANLITTAATTVISIATLAAFTLL